MYRDPNEQRMELVNECMSLMVIEALMALSGDFVDKAKTQTDIGYSLIGLTVFNFAINSVPIGYHIKGLIRLKYLRCKSKREKKA